MRAWTSTAAVVLLVGLAWFGRAAWGGHFLVDESPGMDIYHLSTLYERWAYHVANGDLPSWMPEFGAGIPAPASWMYGLWSPGLLLFTLLPPDVAWTWTALLHMVLGAVGVHRLVHAETDDHLAGATAGILFGLSELMIGRVLYGHLNVVMPVAWAPWVFLHLRGIADGRRGAAAWCVVCTALGLLAGHVQVWFYVAPAALAYAIVAARGVDSRGLYVRALSGVGLEIALLTAIQWLPTVELFDLSERAADTTTDVAAFSTPLHVLVAKLFPGALGYPPDTYWAPDPAMHELGGIGGLLLVALALPALLRRRRGALVWVGIAVAGLLLAPGPTNPVSALLNQLPPVRFGRTPARALLLTTLAGAVLAGRGLAELRRVARETPDALRALAIRSGVVTLAVAAGGAGLLFVLLADSGAGAHAHVFLRAVVTATVLAAAVLAVPLAARTQPRAWLAMPALAVAAVVLGGAQPARSVRSDFYFTDWRALLPAGMQEHRIHLEDARFPNVERQGFRTLREMCYVDARWYHAFVANPGPRRAALLDIGAELAGIPRERLMSGALGADDLVGRPLPADGPGQVFDGARVEPDDARVLAAIDAGEQALYLAEPAGGAGDGPSRRIDGARVARRTGGPPTEERFDVETPRAGWLLVAEKHYPGWEAAVNDAPADIRRANVMFRAVQVPAGSSTVTFRYRPQTLRLGGLLLLLGVIGTIVRAVRDRRAAPPAP